MVALITRSICILAIIAVSAVAAQELPNFSGEWHLESSTANLPSRMTITQTLVTSNVRGEPMTPFYRDITVERELASGTVKSTYHPGSVGGGGIVGGGGPMRRSHIEVQWDGASLVITTGDYTGEQR
jgi:hypothetical protein